MLPAAARLRRRPDFASTIRLGERTGRPPVVVHLRVGAESGASTGIEPVRAGFVVNRAVGDAVVRNRVRRRLRHLVAARLPRITATAPGSTLVVRAAPSAGLASSAELGRALDHALDRVLPASVGVRG